MSMLVGDGPDKKSRIHLVLSAANFVVLIGAIFGGGFHWKEFRDLTTEVPKLSETVTNLRDTVVRLELRLEFMSAADARRRPMRSKQPARVPYQPTQKP